MENKNSFDEMLNAFSDICLITKSYRVNYTFGINLKLGWGR